MKCVHTVRIMINYHFMEYDRWIQAICWNFKHLCEMRDDIPEQQTYLILSKEDKFDIQYFVVDAI